MYLFRPNLKVGATLLEKWIEQVTKTEYIYYQIFGTFMIYIDIIWFILVWKH
jgi:hypothetical protein